MILFRDKKLSNIFSYLKEKNFSELPDLKKAELNQLYIEGLLLETETDEAKLLNELFNLVKNDQVIIVF